MVGSTWIRPSGAKKEIPGKNQNGPWHVAVDRDGTYEFHLRRWPKEADAAISAVVPEHKVRVGVLPAGVPLPIKSAKIRIDGQERSAPVAATDKEVVFTLVLKKNAKTTLQTYFLDADGKELCGAYFTTVERK